MPRVINTSAKVKPRLMVLFPAARNGSLPAPIPVMVLKLPCPPPGNSCYYCVFHNSISFFSCICSFFFFLIKYKTFFGHALALLSLSPQKILFLIKRCSCFALSVYFCSSLLPHNIPDRIFLNPGSVVPQAQLSVRKHI